LISIASFFVENQTTLDTQLSLHIQTSFSFPGEERIFLKRLKAHEMKQKKEILQQAKYKN